MELAAKLDQFETRMDQWGKPAWIALMVLGFILFWPIGLAILAYLLWSGRMGCWRSRGPGRWYNTASHGRRAHHHAAPSSGNLAFDEYREETLRRLEEEQEAFHDFLERLRHAKDKAEFDQFMAERGRPKNAAPDEDPDPSQGRGPATGEGPSPQPAA